MQNYVLLLIKSNSENKQIQLRFMHDFNSIEHAKKEIIAKVSPQSVFENLCFDIIK